MKKKDFLSKLECEAFPKYCLFYTTNSERLLSSILVLGKTWGRKLSEQS